MTDLFAPDKDYMKWLTGVADILNESIDELQQDPVWYDRYKDWQRPEDAVHAHRMNIMRELP